MTSSFAWLVSSVIEPTAPIMVLMVARFKLVRELPSKRYSPLATGVGVAIGVGVGTGVGVGIGVGVGVGLPDPPQPIATMICKPRMIAYRNFINVYAISSPDKHRRKAQ